MKKFVLIVLLSLISFKSFCWGFFGHQRINYYAVFLLPPEMMVLYKPNIQFLSDHSVDPDKRRYAVSEEAPRHYIDIDNYGKYPYTELPRKYEEAVKKFGEDSVQSNGIVPWWIQIMQQRLTTAFKEKNQARILKLSAEIGHYIADSHVPLHASSNHDGQHTNQRGIHAFWEGRVPELLADKEFDFMIGKAKYISDIEDFTWKRVLESGIASDTVLKSESGLSTIFPSDRKFAFENRNGKVTRQYSSAFTVAYNKMINNMVERRMRESIFAIASFWYTAWVNAGQPDLKTLNNTTFTEADQKEFDALNSSWLNSAQKGRTHE